METKHTTKRVARIAGLALVPVLFGTVTVACDADQIGDAIAQLRSQDAEVTVTDPAVEAAAVEAEQADAIAPAAAPAPAIAPAIPPADAEPVSGTIEITYETTDATTITASLLTDDGSTIASAELEANTTYTLDGIAAGTYNIAVVEEAEISETETADGGVGLGWSRAALAQSVTIDADTATVLCQANAGCTVS
ncbi:MAG: hypothetical protein S0880_13515 [Actinomycetota bacterium]|nr:hypothetical protein [Actinomycetota bacterium]